MKLNNIMNEVERPVNNPVNKPETQIKKGIIKWVLMKSKILNGDNLVLILDRKYLKEVRDKFPNVAIYFECEINKLYEIYKSGESIMKIHQLKKEFSGWVVPD